MVFVQHVSDDQDVRNMDKSVTPPSTDCFQTREGKQTGVAASSFNCMRLDAVIVDAYSTPYRQISAREVA